MKLLRLKQQFKNDPLIELKCADESSVATLRRGYSYKEVKAYPRLFAVYTDCEHIRGGSREILNTYL